MKVNTSKSKNAESFYIKQSYLDAHGKSTSRTIRKLGTLNELLIEHGPTRDDVMNWAKEQARIETEKYEQAKENHCLPVIFHPNRKIPHGEKRKFQGGYLFLQSWFGLTIQWISVPSFKVVTVPSLEVSATSEYTASTRSLNSLFQE